MPAKARAACVVVSDEEAGDEWFNRILAQPRLQRYRREVGGFVWTRPTRTLADLDAKAPVVERWVRRKAARHGVALAAGCRVVRMVGDPASADPLDHVGSLGVRIEVVDD